MIYLASKSPRRTELLSQVEIEHQIIEISSAENVDEGLSPSENAENISLQKCQEGIRYILKEEMPIFPVLSADTMVILGSKIFGKPESREHAIEILMELSGQVHTVITGVSIGTFKNDQTKFQSISVKSFVEFGNLSVLECEKYCDTHEPFGKAGAYAIQGLGGKLIKEIKGSYSNIVGLPLFETAQLLENLKASPKDSA